jgi:hypothetical protein
MENKTISYLNSRAWYRLLKVVYVFAFLLVSSGSVAIINELHGTRQIDDYRVVCNYGNRMNFLAHTDKSIYLSDYELRNGLTDIPDYEKESLQTACGISKAEIQSKLAAFLTTLGTIKPLVQTRLTLPQPNTEQQT